MGDLRIMDCRPEIIVSDACVLIDYCLTNKKILRLVSRHIWKIYVLRPVFVEVKELDEETADTLEIEIIDPDISQLQRAGKRGGGLSRSDRLCFLAAKDNGWNCWTNDIGLRKLCKKEEVPVYWGLEVMISLYRLGHITIVDAIETARKIHKINKKHITEEIIARFINKINEPIE